MSNAQHEPPATAPTDPLATPPEHDPEPPFTDPLRESRPEDDPPGVPEKHPAEDVPRSRRPISYPYGPESAAELPKVELIGFNPLKRNSDPLKVPPVKSKTQVKPFTKESLEKLQKKTVQLVREYGFQPRRKLSVEDGSRLPAKFEPFPTKLYGRPLEEIDNFIYDEVGLGMRDYSRFGLIASPFLSVLGA
ncbi:hypothetical protein JTB14_020377 [Gonioctena quinquepunctata]|nr:hypothetical protein JTB14_020377 [Gonioctena quinquepunctata]